MITSATGETLSELRSVLLVEDEYFLAADLEDAPTDVGFATDAVPSGEEALTLFIGGTITYRALVTDIRLSGSMSLRESTVGRCG